MLAVHSLGSLVLTGVMDCLGEVWVCGRVVTQWCGCPVKWDSAAQTLVPNQSWDC